MHAITEGACARTEALLARYRRAAAAEVDARIEFWRAAKALRVCDVWTVASEEEAAMNHYTEMKQRLEEARTTAADACWGAERAIETGFEG